MISITSYSDYKTTDRSVTQYLLINDLFSTTPVVEDPYETNGFWVRDSILLAEFPSLTGFNLYEASDSLIWLSAQRKNTPLYERRSLDVNVLWQGSKSPIGNNDVHHEKYDADVILVHPGQDWQYSKYYREFVYVGQTREVKARHYYALPYGTQRLRINGSSRGEEYLFFWGPPSCCVLVALRLEHGKPMDLAYVYWTYTASSVYYSKGIRLQGSNAVKQAQDLRDSFVEYIYNDKYSWNRYNPVPSNQSGGLLTMSWTTELSHSWFENDYEPIFDPSYNLRARLHGYKQDSAIMTADEKTRLSQRLIDSFRVNHVNLYTYVPDLKKFGDELKVFEPIADTSFRKVLKKGADLELSVKYGSRLTVADTQEIIDELSQLKDNLPKNWTKRHVWDFSLNGSRRCRATAYLGNPEWYLAEKLFNAYSLGVLPSLENAWDAVPYSFVVDWFLHISDALNTIQMSVFGDLLPLQEICYSLTRDYMVPLRYNGQTIWVSSHVYDRWTEYEFTTSYVQPSDGKPFQNWVEAAALLIQRLL